jgi:phospholipid/cholesterol/gamma-HCH transport system substrate-binding protein
MKSNKQYIIVGAFVIIATTLLVGVWLWFSAHNRTVYDTYLAVFDESVDGVTTSSVVKYNGVEVGRVKQLELDPQNPRSIRVYLNIQQGVALSTATVATMKAQGVTGMSYISLSVPHNVADNGKIVPHNQKPYPQIQTRPSLLSSLSDQAQSIAQNINGVSSEIKDLLNDKNSQHLSNILANMDKLMAAIATRSEDVSKSISTTAEILHNVKKNSENLNETFNQIQDLTKTLAETTATANQMLMEVHGNTLQSVNSVLLPNLNGAIAHLNQSSYQLEQLLRLLNDNPSALIRGKNPQNPGPGE